jgi:hypothetical protein
VQRSSFDPLLPSAHRPAHLHCLLQPSGRVIAAGAMPRYFFDLHDDIDAVDEEGVELSDLNRRRPMLSARLEP